MATLRFILIVPTDKKMNSETVEEQTIKLNPDNTTMFTEEEFKKRLKLSDVSYNNLLFKRNDNIRPVGIAARFGPTTKNDSSEGVSLEGTSRVGSTRVSSGSLGPRKCPQRLAKRKWPRTPQALQERAELAHVAGFGRGRHRQRD